MGAPEKKVVIELKKFFQKHSDFFDVNVIEAKANYSASAGRYMHGAVSPGYSDMSGNDKFGRAMFLEVKAPKKISTIRIEQYIFLCRKIEMNCFAVCVDSVDMFKDLYAQWHKLQGLQAQEFLKSKLKPSKKIRDILEDDSPLFE